MAGTKKKVTVGRKPAEKDVKELVRLLQLEWSQAPHFEPYVEKLADARGLLLAETALGRVKKGLRRTYFAARVAQAKGDAAGATKLANEFCKGYGAAAEGHLQLAACFSAVAALANDVAAIHAAVTALAGADPYHSHLLPIAAANAEARGDAASAAFWSERAATSKRVLPAISDLRRDGDKVTRAKGRAALEAMTLADQSYVLRRLAWRPEMFDEATVERSVLAALDDDAMTSASWLAALGKIGDDDEDTDASKSLRARIAADDAVVDRLVRRVVEGDEQKPPTFEGGELEEDEIYKGACTAFFALRGHAGDPRVFAVITRAIEGAKERVRLQRAVLVTFLDGLYCGAEAWPTLSDAQAGRCFEWVISQARKGPNQQAADHALSYWARPGAEDLVEQALETEKVEDVCEGLYAVAHQIGARDVLVRRISKEKEHFWRLQHAIGHLWTPEWHAAILDQLDAWADPRLAEIYLEALRDHVKKDAPIVDVLRRVMAWPPASGNAARYLKRVLIEGARAAIDQHEYALAKNAWALASAIKAQPLSNEWSTERRSAVPDPFKDKNDKKKLGQLLSGALEKAEAAAKAAVDAARASGKPRKASNDTLAALAGGDVQQRLFEDATTREVLFLAGDQLRFYDGYGLVDVPWRSEPLAALTVALANETRCDERALAWDKPGNDYLEVVRWGVTVMLVWGKNNDYHPAGRIVRFDDAASAHAFFEKVRGAAPDDLSFGSGYHLAGKGGVAREYNHAPYRREGDDEDTDSTTEAVLGARWAFNGGRRFDSADAAERDYESWELELYKSGGSLKNLEWMDRLQRDEDRPIHAWLADRAREDRQTIAWHLDALPEFERALRAQRLWPDSATVALEPAATREEIDAFAADVEMFPSKLRELWETTAGATWKVGAKQQHVLGPRAALAARAKLAAWVDRFAPGWGTRRPRHEPLFRACEVIAMDQNGGPIVVAHCKNGAGDSAFMSVEPDEPKQDSYGTDSLAWHLCTTFTDDLVNALGDAEPLIYALKYGEAAPANRKTVTLGSGDKVWSAILDEAGSMFFTVAGKRGGDRRSARKKHKDGATAKKAFDAAVKAKRAEGFR